MAGRALLLPLLALAAPLAGGYRLTLEPEDATPTDGGLVVLRCEAEPSAAISWRYGLSTSLDDAVPLDLHHNRYRKQLDDGSLQINAAHESVLGFYQCVATFENVGTVTSRTASVTVPKLPGFEAEPQDLEVFKGESAYFACALRGTYSVGSLKPLGPRTHPVDTKNLNLKVQWLKNEAPLRFDDTRMALMPSGALEIETTDLQDQGTYRCNVSAYGAPVYRLSNKAQLTVSADMTMAEMVVAPEFIAQPRSQTVIEGSSVTMDCAASGHPRPDIIWLNKGVRIDLSDLDSRFTLYGTGVLHIRSVNESDAGNYQCRADNREDSKDANAILDVQVPPRFLKKPTDATALERQDLELPCEVYGKPEPIVYWLKNGDIITPNNHDMTFVNGHNLRIQGLMIQDAGIFQCVASNSAGNIQESARLIVASSDIEESDVSSELTEDEFTTNLETDDERSVPSMPINFKAAIVKSRFVALSWREPQITNGDIITYSVLYRVSSAPRERMMNTTRKDVHEINISQLEPNTTYQFRIVAYNSNGRSPSPPTLEITTQSEDQSLSPPKNLNVTVINSNMIGVSWEPPYVVPGSKMAVDKYQLFWSEIETGMELSSMTVDLNYRITNLKPFTDYGIRIVALAAGADSASSDRAGAPTDQLIVKTLGDAPSDSPSNIKLLPHSATSIMMQWDAPPPETRNGYITGYKIKYKHGRKKAESITTPADTREVILKDLDRTTQYQVRICAFNINGSGPFSDWYSVETLQNNLDESRTPDEPSPIKAQAGSDSIFISWSPPRNQNIKIRGYTLSWGKGVPDQFQVKMNESSRHFTIKNLEQNSEYVIILRASNQIGEGVPVYSTVRTLDKSIIGEGEDDSEEIDPNLAGGHIPSLSATPLIPPVGLKADVLSGTTAVVYWTDTTLPKSQLVNDQRHYVIRYCPVGLQCHRYFNTTHLNFMIDELLPNTQYEFTVKVVNGNRESQWSMVVVNNTLEEVPASYPRDLKITVPDSPPNSVNLHWSAPKKANGIVTGYVILYTTDRARRDRDWVVQAVVGGGSSATVRSLKPSTQYHFKVQARNAKGYGPFCPLVTFITPSGEEIEEAEGTSANNKEGSQTPSMLIYIIIGVVGIVVIVGVIITSVLCCRRASAHPPTSPDTRSKVTYQKSSASNIKPPDLWIHHDQMELKQTDKCHHSSSGSGDGGSCMSAMTLPRPPPPRDSCEYDTAMPSGGSLHSHPPTGSLDKRHYVPTYVAMSSINTCGMGSGIGDSLGSSGVRSMYPRTQYSLGPSTRNHSIIDQNTPLLSATGSSMSGTLPSQSSMSSLGQIGTTLPLHHSIAGSMGISPISCSQASCGISTGGSILLGSAPSPSPSPASEGFPADAREREQGHYVAYEALHPPRDSLDSSSTIGSLGRAHAGSAHPLKSFSVPAPPPSEAPHTPHHHNKVSVTIRPTNTSPYKKPLIPQMTSISSPGMSINRLQQGVTVPHSSEEAEALAPSHSTERLHQEMANLEGLMKDLNAITASQFEC